MPRGNQLTRQWRLLQFLDRPAGITVDDAARELECTVRTIWRDLKVLQDAGFPIYDDKEDDGRRGVWRVNESFRAQLPLKLSLAELAALLMSRDLLAPLGVSVLGPSVSSAFEKIASALSRDAVKLIEAMRDTVGARTAGAKLQLPAADHLPRIQEALVERRSLRIRHHALHRGEDTERTVDPYHLTYFNGGVYLVAYCHLRRALRIFAAERLRAVTVLATRFTRPASFDAERYLQQSWGILRGDLVTVRVVFSPGVAKYIAERLWHPSQKLRPLPDGRLEVTLEVADTLEVRRWILGYGVQAEVMEPASLREALRAEAEALAARLAPRRAPLAQASMMTQASQRGRRHA
jgi:predicted DNA-binding transcriptional regulator YafY